jgi:hypothetical protein
MPVMNNEMESMIKGPLHSTETSSMYLEEFFK